jgi:methylenetetrahydrofolate dehydrogenase (NADP+)/methenyltetrahydrofolate cyclohydrolase
MTVNGRAIASDILSEVRASLAGRVPVVRAVVMSPSPATESYLSIKKARAEEAGMRLEVARVPDDADTAAVVAAVKAEGADAVIVQLPLPPHVDTDAALAAIPLSKDADVLSPDAYARFVRGDEGALPPPVAGAIAEILTRAGVDAAGKRAAVVGQGKLVGKPALILLRRLGADAVAVLKDTPEPARILREADIVVSGAGQAHLITKDMVKAGSALIDAGTSESGGAIAGDIDPACAEAASVFTPVPGGVGPVAVACLFKNVAALLG